MLSIRLVCASIFILLVQPTFAFDSSLVLSANNLGPLLLSKGAKISKERLIKLFPSFTVNCEIAQGDSPDFYYFEVQTLEGELLFTIKSFISESTESKDIKAEVPIDLLQIYSIQIRDRYGIRVGDHVKEIILKRGTKLNFSAGHHDVSIGSKEIFYNVSTGSEWSPENFTIKDAIKGNWQINSISWPGPAWE